MTRHQQIIDLAEKGYSAPQIADMLDCSEKTIHARQRKGLLPRNHPFSDRGLKAWCISQARAKGFTPEELGPLFSLSPSRIRAIPPSRLGTHRTL